ncbi:Hypothetical predicted protein [Pelobates cultripes]|uniref:Uncharacterized protein n=1 Tax=Pelobates cultripes TaxID=61616 RepID=A0AAD1RJE7_PELCU|nr:Hypothetical predicted protein [Pelobates cultripes]
MSTFSQQCARSKFSSPFECNITLCVGPEHQLALFPGCAADKRAFFRLCTTCLWSEPQLDIGSNLLSMILLPEALYQRCKPRRRD